MPRCTLLYLTSLGFLEFLGCLKFFHQFWKLLPITSQLFFQPCSLSPPPETYIIHKFVCLMLFYGSLRLCSFFINILFLSVLHVDNFPYSIFKFTDSLSQICHWFFYIIPPPYWDSLLIHLLLLCFLLIYWSYFWFSSIQFSHSVMSDSLRPHESKHARPPCPSPTPGVHSDSRPLSRWCHPAISSSVVPFSSCP